MDDENKSKIGSISWTDLTVPDADKIRDFYMKVVGWKPEGVDMGGYQDYNMMLPSGGGPAVGICHARGTNASLPAQWLVYITVENLDESVRQAESLGGEILAGPQGGGSYGRYCVIMDPAGAVAALFEPAEK